MKALTREQLEDELEAKILAGDITVEEAEMEWQDYMHRGEIPFMACMDGKERKEKGEMRNEMSCFDVKKVLGNDKFAVSKVRVTVLDRRTKDRSVIDIYVLGEKYYDVHASRALGDLGFDLLDAEIVDTQRGIFSLKSMFDAFEAAKMLGGQNDRFE